MAKDDNLCSCCGGAQNAEGACLNVDCTRAAQNATRAAGRSTRKATASAYQPNAWQSSGRVD